MSKTRLAGCAALAVLLLLPLVAGCERGVRQNAGEVLAEVGSERLTLDRVPQEIFSYEGQDSLTLLRAYVERWVLQHAVYQYAAKSTPAHRVEEIAQRVEEYRQMLMVADYEQRLVLSQLDTSISQAAIEALYEANSSHFTLEQPIVRCLSLAVPKSCVQLKALRDVYAQRSADVIEQVEPLAFSAGVRLATYPGTWLSLADLERALGVKIDEGRVTSRPVRLDFMQDSTVYLLSFHEWREAGTVAPLAYVAEEAKAILLNHRRKRLVDSVERSIVDQGCAEGKVKLFAQ